MKPIGQILRQKTKKARPAPSSLKSLDELISKLENESPSEGDTESDSEDYIGVETDSNGNVIKMVSKLRDESDLIAPLPAHLLPLPACLKRKGDDHNPSKVRFATPSANPKKKRVDGNEIETTQVAVEESKVKKSGLETTVREMLKNYVPASSERRPLWCRICRFQGECLADWNAHMQTEEHAVASKVEKKMSFCRLCKKQFTSPDQLKDHIKGKPHKEKLQIAQDRQSLSQKYC